MRKTAKILALVLGAAYAIGVAGCGEKEKTYDIPRDQYGFVCKPPIIISDPGMVIEVMAEAYRILEEEYDKSNVKIQIGYGTLRGKTNDLPEEGTFQMYFRDADIPFPCEENGCGYFIKDIEVKDFISEDYIVDKVIREDDTRVYLFRHVEIVKIPEELFSKPEGELVWFIQADEEYMVAAFTINYQMTGDKVVLSVPERYFE